MGRCFGDMVLLPGLWGTLGLVLGKEDVEPAACVSNSVCAAVQGYACEAPVARRLVKAAGEEMTLHYVVQSVGSLFRCLHWSVACNAWVAVEGIVCTVGVCAFRMQPQPLPISLGGLYWKCKRGWQGGWVFLSGVPMYSPICVCA